MPQKVETANGVRNVDVTKIFLDHMLPKENIENPIDITPYITSNTPLDLIPLLLVSKQTYRSGKSYYDHCIRTEGQKVEKKLLKAIGDLYFLSHEYRNLKKIDSNKETSIPLLRVMFFLRIFTYLLRIGHTEFYEKAIDNKENLISSLCNEVLSLPLPENPFEISLWGWKKEPRTVADYQFLLDTYYSDWSDFKEFKSEYAKEFVQSEKNSMFYFISNDGICFITKMLSNEISKLKSRARFLEIEEKFVEDFNHIETIRTHLKSNSESQKIWGLEADKVKFPLEQQASRNIEEVYINTSKKHKDQNIVDYMDQYQEFKFLYEKIQSVLTEEAKRQITQCVESYPDLKNCLNIFEDALDEIENINDFIDLTLEDYFSPVYSSKGKEALLHQYNESIRFIWMVQLVLDS